MQSHHRAGSFVEAELETEPQPILSAVIVNFNAGPLIARAIDGVLATSLPTEVIVSDNGSSEGSLAPVLTLADGDPRVKVLRNGANLGFARANNLAFAQSRGAYLLVLNPDCIPQPGAIERVVEVLGSNPAAGMAGCLIQNPDGSEQRGCRRRLPTPLASLAVFLRLDRVGASRGAVNLNREPLPTEPVAVEAISGAFMLVRRQAVETVGPFDEGYFLHCEDLDWCARFHQAGWKILFVPDAQAVHFQGGCSRDRPLFVLWHKHRGMARFYRKFQARQYGLAFGALVMLGIWGRFTLLAVPALVRALFRRGPASRSRV